MGDQALPHSTGSFQNGLWVCLTLKLGKQLQIISDCKSDVQFGRLRKLFTPPPATGDTGVTIREVRSRSGRSRLPGGCGLVSADDVCILNPEAFSEDLLHAASSHKGCVIIYTTNTKQTRK